MRLDTAKDKTHRLAVELFSRFGDERPAELQCRWLLRLTNRKIWPTHTVSPAGTQKGKNLVAATVMRSSSITPPPAREKRSHWLGAWLPAPATAAALQPRHQAKRPCRQCRASARGCVAHQLGGLKWFAVIQVPQDVPQDGHRLPQGQTHWHHWVWRFRHKCHEIRANSV